MSTVYDIDWSYGDHKEEDEPPTRNSFDHNSSANYSNTQRRQFSQCREGTGTPLAIFRGGSTKGPSISTPLPTPAPAINLSPVTRCTTQYKSSQCKSQLVSVSSVISREYQKLFPFQYFNGVQSRVIHRMLNSTDNAVIAAPTGSGKTVVIELAIVAELLSKQASQNHTHTGDGGGKIVYIAPVRALCSERFANWKAKFSKIGVSVGEFTGDSENISTDDLQKSQIIITTPEKWDSITRNWRSRKSVMNQIKLVLLDEIHTLNDTRGPTLEVIICRMNSQSKERIRFIGISATVPNVEDLGEWFSFQGTVPSYVEKFGDEFRPVPLTTHVVGYYNTHANIFQFEKNLESHILSLYEKYSDNMPALAFCGTRKACEGGAETLFKKACTKVSPGSRQHPFVRDHNTMEDLQQKAQNVAEPKLAKLLQHGLAFHHGGLTSSDRKIVESLFLASKIKIICTTSTLSCGVNLPAHLVIIKSTRVWDGATQKHQDISSMDLLQMVGRAGRPQFDTTGTAVVMCDMREKEKYEKILSSSEIVESKLHQSLVEHVNAEVGLGTIFDEHSALQWLKSTFLYVRMQKNPAAYHFTHNELVGLKALEKCVGNAIASLTEANLIVQDQRGRLKQTITGETMSKYYVKFETMQKIGQMGKNMERRDILALISQADEFSELRFETGEKKALNDLNTIVKYKSEGKVHRICDKIFILIQAQLGRLSIPGQLQRGVDNTVRTATRVTKCVIAVAVNRKDAITAVNAQKLAAQLNVSLWDDEDLQLLQIDGIGDSYCQKLRNVGLKTIQDVQNGDSCMIAGICNKKPLFGEDIVKRANSFPKISINVTKVETMSSSKIMGHDTMPSKVDLQISVKNSSKPMAGQKSKTKLNFQFVSLISFTSDESFMDFRRIKLVNLSSDNYPQPISLTVPAASETFTIHAICDSYVGFDVFETVALGYKSQNNEIGDSSYPLPDVNETFEPMDNYSELLALDDTPAPIVAAPSNPAETKEIALVLEDYAYKAKTKRKVSIGKAPLKKKFDSGAPTKKQKSEPQIPATNRLTSKTLPSMTIKSKSNKKGPKEGRVFGDYESDPFDIGEDLKRDFLIYGCEVESPELPSAPVSSANRPPKTPEKDITVDFLEDLTVQKSDMTGEVATVGDLNLFQIFGF